MPSQKDQTTEREDTHHLLFGSSNASNKKQKDVIQITENQKGREKKREILSVKKGENEKRKRKRGEGLFGLLVGSLRQFPERIREGENRGGGLLFVPVVAICLFFRKEKREREKRRDSSKKN